MTIFRAVSYTHLVMVAAWILLPTGPSAWEMIRASRPDYNDADWRKLNLPHDWAIEGEFSKDNPSGTGGGALPGGIDVYKRQQVCGGEHRSV